MGRGGEGKLPMQNLEPIMVPQISIFQVTTMSLRVL